MWGSGEGREREKERKITSKLNIFFSSKRESSIKQFGIVTIEHTKLIFFQKAIFYIDGFHFYF